MHKEKTEAVWLKNEEIAEIVADRLRYHDGKSFNLKTFCIMSNHVHVVFRPLLDRQFLAEQKGSNPLRFESSAPTLGKIMQSIKGFTAYKANKVLSRRGKFWEEESYDHEIRNEEELNRIVKYVLNNPVKAGLVKNWREWQWTWLRED